MGIKIKFFEPLSYHPNTLEKFCTLQIFTNYWKNRVAKPLEQPHFESISIYAQINVTFAVSFWYGSGFITLFHTRYTCNTNILEKPCMHGFTKYWKTRVEKPHEKIPLGSKSTLVHINISHAVLFKYKTEISLFYMEIIYELFALNYVSIFFML